MFTRGSCCSFVGVLDRLAPSETQFRPQNLEPRHFTAYRSDGGFVSTPLATVVEPEPEPGLPSKGMKVAGGSLLATDKDGRRTVLDDEEVATTKEDGESAARMAQAKLDAGGPCPWSPLPLHLHIKHTQNQDTLHIKH